MGRISTSDDISKTAGFFIQYLFVRMTRSSPSYMQLSRLEVQRLFQPSQKLFAWHLPSALKTAYYCVSKINKKAGFLWTYPLK
jgi:hypothetical protein